MISIGIKKLHDSVNIPNFATTYSACFDLEAFFHEDSIKTMNEDGTNGNLPVLKGETVVIPPRVTALIPTGIIFSIPSDMSIKIYSRSSMAFKRNLIVANGVGIIDADYLQETFVMLKNNSRVNQIINSHDRIAQGEISKINGKNVVEFAHIIELPLLDSNRTGGIGSTGV